MNTKIIPMFKNIAENTIEPTIENIIENIPIIIDKD